MRERRTGNIAELRERKKGREEGERQTENVKMTGGFQCGEIQEIALVNLNITSFNKSIDVEFMKYFQKSSLVPSNIF